MMTTEGPATQRQLSPWLKRACLPLWRSTTLIQRAEAGQRGVAAPMQCLRQLQMYIDNDARPLGSFGLILLQAHQWYLWSYQRGCYRGNGFMQARHQTTPAMAIHY